MRWVLVIIGALMVLLGGIWLLQGTGLLPGSFMSGQTFWATVGMIVLLAGLALCAAGLRRGTARPRP
ncbi:MAG TPA: hypothetical protein VFW96_28835 [Thermomicrobiales bacterium]|nr:hypothetical protein [Thermomicrobiales bacterium]